MDIDSISSCTSCTSMPIFVSTKGLSILLALGLLLLIKERKNQEPDVSQSKNWVKAALLYWHADCAAGTSPAPPIALLQRCVSLSEFELYTGMGGCSALNSYCKMYWNVQEIPWYVSRKTAMELWFLFFPFTILFIYLQSDLISMANGLKLYQSTK